MSSLRRLCLVCFVCLAGLLPPAAPADPQATSVQQKSWLTRFNEWSCHVSGFGCEKTAVNLTASRSIAGPRPRGGDLVLRDLDTGRERVLWSDCHCWSPVPVESGRLAVATASGIELLEISDPERHSRIFHSEAVRELLGMRDHELVFVGGGSEPGCSAPILQLKLQAHEVPRPAPPAGGVVAPCASDLDFLSLVRPAQLLGGRKLITLSLQGRYEIDVIAGGRTAPLLTASGGEDPERFDPVWIDSRTIVYVSRP